MHEVARFVQATVWVPVSKVGVGKGARLGLFD